MFPKHPVLNSVATALVMSVLVGIAAVAFFAAANLLIDLSLSFVVWDFHLDPLPAAALRAVGAAAFWIAAGSVIFSPKSWHDHIND